jgi:release factor glutamine methyltransferase
MHKRVLDYEPSIALFVEDENPLSFYHAILRFGQRRLINNGKLYFEINEKYGQEVACLYEKYGYTDIELRQDIHGKDRMICGTMKLR